MNHDSKGVIFYLRAFALAYEIQCVTLLDLDICERQMQWTIKEVILFRLL